MNWLQSTAAHDVVVGALGGMPFFLIERLVSFVELPLDRDELINFATWIGAGRLVKGEFNRTGGF